MSRNVTKTSGSAVTSTLLVVGKGRVGGNSADSLATGKGKVGCNSADSLAESKVLLCLCFSLSFVF